MDVESEIVKLRARVEQLEATVQGIQPQKLTKPMKPREFMRMFGAKKDGVSKPMAYATFNKLVAKGMVTVEFIAGRRYVVDYVGRES